MARMLHGKSVIAVILMAAAIGGILALWQLDKQPRPDRTNRSDRLRLTPDERAWLDRHPLIRLAPDPDFPPLEYFDKNGTYRGLIADLMKIMQRHLEGRLEFVRLPDWKSVLEQARERRIDGITAAQFTAERGEYLRFTDPLIDIPNVIIVRTGTAERLSFTDLAGKRLAVTSGNALHEHVRTVYPAIVIIPVQNDLAALQAVSFGICDATVINQAIASCLINKNGIANLRVAGDSGKSNPLMIATRGDEPQLASILNKVLNIITGEERQEITARWFGLETGSLDRGDWILVLLLSGGLFILTVISGILYLTMKRLVATRTRELSLERDAQRTSRARLVEAQRIARIGNWELDHATLTVTMSEETMNIFGNPAHGGNPTLNECLGRVNPDDLALTKAAFIAAMQSREPSVLEFRIVAAEGRMLSVRMHVETSFDRDGKPFRSFGTLQDVTESRHAEEALRDSEQKFRAIFNSTEEAIFIHDAETGRVLDVNASMLRLYEYANKEAALAANFADVMSGEPPHTIEHARELISAATGDTPLVFEWLARKADGTHFWVEVSLRRTRIDSRDRILAVVRDIGERKKMEAERERSSRLWSNTFNSMSDIIAVIALDHRFMEINQAGCDALGLPREEIIGQKCHKLVHCSDTPLFVCPCSATLRSKKIETAEINEHGRDYQLTTWPILDGNQELIAFSHAIRDITELKQTAKKNCLLEAQLRQEQKISAVGTLANGVAHEINNPLTVVMNYAQLIMDNLPEDNRQLHGYCGEIIRESNRIAYIVRTLLSFSRQSQTSFSRENFGEITRGILALMERLLVKEQISLEIEIAPDLPAVRCAAPQIQQVLLNLLTNARDALNERYPETSANKQIRISIAPFADETGTYIRATVRDRGKGIADTDKEHIFEPFFTTKDPNCGTGLGLSVSHGIARDHGGRLTFESWPGAGTAFHLDLPADNTPDPDK